MSSNYQLQPGNVLSIVDKFGNVEYGSFCSDVIFWYPSCEFSNVKKNDILVDNTLHMSCIYSRYGNNDTKGFCTNIEKVVCAQDVETKLVLTNINTKDLSPYEFNSYAYVCMDDWIGKVKNVEYTINMSTVGGRKLKLKVDDAHINRHLEVNQMSFSKMPLHIMYSLLGNTSWQMAENKKHTTWPLSEMFVETVNVNTIYVDWIYNTSQENKSSKRPPTILRGSITNQIHFVNSGLINGYIGDCYIYEIKGNEKMIDWDTWQSQQKAKHNIPQNCTKNNEPNLQVIKKFNKGTKLLIKILSRNTKADFVRQDGIVICGVKSISLYLNGTDVLLNEYYPGDFVVNWKNHPTLYGVVQSSDQQNKTAVVKRYHICNFNRSIPPVLIDTKTTSIYDLKMHRAFHFQPKKIVHRIAFIDDQNDNCKIGTVIGSSIDQVKVKWLNGLTTFCWPQELYIINNDMRTDHNILFNQVNNIENVNNDTILNNLNEVEESQDDSEDNENTEHYEYNNKCRGFNLNSHNETTTMSHFKTELNNYCSSLIDENMICINGCFENFDILNVIHKKFNCEEFDGNNKSKPPPEEKRKAESVELQVKEIPIEPIPEEKQGDLSFMESAPSSHNFYNRNFQPLNPTNFNVTVRKELNILNNSLPCGIWVKGFEDRIDLYCVMIRGPAHTPYEDGLFLFDVKFPNDYPISPPDFKYISFSKEALNPNLYLEGKVCVSLLGTWHGQNTENWNSKSSTLLQVVTSIQALILNAEPYFNEPGFEEKKGTSDGDKKRNQYNETVLLNTYDAQIKLMKNPSCVFKQEIYEHFKTRGGRMVARLKNWDKISTEYHEMKGSSVSLTFDEFVNERNFMVPDFPLLPASKGFSLSLSNILQMFKKVLIQFIDEESEILSSESPIESEFSSKEIQN